MPFPTLPKHLGEVRDLVNRFKVGDEASFEAFTRLVNLLLRLTVVPPEGSARMIAGPRADTRVIGGWSGIIDPLPLNEGGYLRLTITLFREPYESGHRLKVEKSSYQYQTDQNGDDWVFRYDYDRTPPRAPYPYPLAHLQVRGNLESPSVLSKDQPLHKVHFPTGRVSLEAVIRLLVEGFNVPCRTAPEIWRPVLAESERLFQEIAHRPLSGPSE